MKDIKNNLQEIMKKKHDLFWLMILLFLSGMALFVTSLVTLKPNTSIANVGYGDIGGYRTGNWTDMLAFSIMALILGVLHNLLAIKITNKRGDGLAKVLVVTSILLVIGAFVVLIRLLGEG